MSLIAFQDDPNQVSGRALWSISPDQRNRNHLRPQDLSALIDWLAKSPPAVLNPDLSRIGAAGFSTGGFSVLATACLRASKLWFDDYCDANRGKLDCGWHQQAGLDLASLPQSALEASNLDPRIRTVAAMDPALSQAFQTASAQNISVPTLILNMGVPGPMPPLNAAALGATIPDAGHSYIRVPVISSLGMNVA